MNKKKTIRLNESQLRQIVKESVKRVLNEGENNISVMKLKAWADKVVSELQNGSNACYYKCLGESNCKTGEMYIVIGWMGGYADDEPDNPNADGRYRICAKLAYNCDNLQCDYDWDWEMPYDEETGMVDDTNSEYDDGTIEWLYDHWKKYYRVLMEGKVVNHKPYFQSEYGFVKQPGEYIDEPLSSRPIDRNKLKTIRDVVDYVDDAEKHNSRANNYILGDFDDENNRYNYILKGSKEYYDKLQRWTPEFRKMCAFNGISEKEYNEMPDNKQASMWLYYNLKIKKKH